MLYISFCQDRTAHAALICPFYLSGLLRGKLGAIPSNSKKTTGLGQRLRKGAQELLTYEAPAFKDSHSSYGTTYSLTISVMSISQLRKIDSLAAANTIFLCALEIQFYYLLLWKSSRYILVLHNRMMLLWIVRTKEIPLFNCLVFFGFFSSFTAGHLK